MSFMRIHCSCGRSWEIYARDDWKAEKARQCPHCGKHINQEIWDKEVLPAFAAASDSNNELYKYHTGYNKPLFSVDYVSNTKRPKGRNFN